MSRENDYCQQRVWSVELLGRWASVVPVLQAFVLALPMLGLGCGSSRPIALTPELSSDRLAMIECPATSAQFFLEEVIDKRGNADPRDVGFTQTGLFNVLAPLNSNPPPAELLRLAFVTLLDRCNLRSTDRNSADYAIMSSLIALQTTEVTGMFVESIEAGSACEIAVRDAATEKLQQRAIVRATAERRGMDTTGHASDVIVGSLIGLAVKFGALLECCQGGVSP